MYIIVMRTARSAQYVASHPLGALAPRVVRWVARIEGEPRMCRNLLIHNEFAMMHPQYDIVLM
jgi:hypothetical protein